LILIEALVWAIDGGILAVGEALPELDLFMVGRSRSVFSIGLNTVKVLLVFKSISLYPCPALAFIQQVLDHIVAGLSFLVDCFHFI
jgi:hypothetical protein